MEDIRVAAVCMNAVAGEIEENLVRIRSLALEASTEGADIVCFPELCVSGYSLEISEEFLRSLDAQKIVERLISISQEAALVLIAGLIELEAKERPCISQIVIGPNGLIGRYRKTHLPPPERKAYNAGSELQVFSYTGTTFGIQLCYEGHFPELSTTMALMGAEVIFFPHASPGGSPEEKLDSWMRHLPARAFDNGVFIVACNQTGETPEGYSFPGVALFLTPEGRILKAHAGSGKKVLFADLDSQLLKETRSHRMKYFLPSRRPKLYKILTQM